MLGLDHEDYILAKIGDASRILCDWGVEVQPGLQNDPPDGTFLLRQKDAGISSEAAVWERLSQGESASQEFKSSYWCDLRRRANQPGATCKQLRSDDVKHSALKAVAGFLTTGGGTLYIGVSDEGEVLGLRPDLGLLQEDRRNIDHLTNNIRTDIADRFRDGNTVNDYVSIEAVDIAEAQILQLKVTSRHKLSFLAKSRPDYQLFRRQGNRTTKVKIHEFEEFQATRNKYNRPVE